MARLFFYWRRPTEEQMQEAQRLGAKLLDARAVNFGSCPKCDEAYGDVPERFEAYRMDVERMKKYKKKTSKKKATRKKGK